MTTLSLYFYLTLLRSITKWKQRRRESKPNGRPRSMDPWVDAQSNAHDNGDGPREYSQHLQKPRLLLLTGQRISGNPDL